MILEAGRFGLAMLGVHSTKAWELMEGIEDMLSTCCPTRQDGEYEV